MCLLILGGFEGLLQWLVVPIERRNETAVKQVEFTPPNHYELGGQDPEAFAARIARVPGSTIVLVGDSQGLVVQGAKGKTCSEVIAAELAAGPNPPTVVNLHMAGSNVFEQAAVLLTLLQAGVVPDAVLWSHGIMSHGRNDIRAEVAHCAATAGIARFAPVVTLGAAAAADETGEAPARETGLAAAWSRVASTSATVRFAARPLAQKMSMIGHSPLRRLLPAFARQATARQDDPPKAILLSAADVVRETSRILRGRGVRVIHFLGPVNRRAVPAPFTERAAKVSFPALEQAARSSESEFLDLTDLLPPERYGKYEDGSADAHHLDASGHRELGLRLLSTLAAPGMTPR